MTQQNNTPSNKLLRLPEVLKIVPVSRSTWYRGVDSGIYPKPVKISKRAVAWRADEISHAIENF